MQTKQRDIFTTIHTEGSILPADLLQRIGDGDTSLDGLRPEDYHLPKGEKLNEATNRSWNHLLGAWASFKALAERHNGDPGTTETREKWLLPLFQELGYGRLRKCQDSGHAIFLAMFNPSHPRPVGPKARATMLPSARIVRHQIAAGT